jgi:2,4-dienoyl-CoA reductase-like NADH-dependent reductase (Old Yellow Enzyme family)/thioredoxin reductase
MSAPKYPHICEPLKIRNFTLKNRLEASNSLPHFLQGPEPYPAESVIAHYANKARSAGIVTCMGINNFTRGKQLPMDMDFGHFPDFDLYDTNCQNYLLQLADNIHYFDSIACMAIFVGPPSAYPLMKPKGEQGHMSMFEQTESLNAPPPAEFDLELIPGHDPVESYTEEMLEKIALSYAEQAGILQMLGFDMMSIHMCYRANIPAQFFSPLTNHRTDKFGGSLENRMRFPLMVLERVRQKVGKNFILEIEWSAEDAPGGFTIEESAAFLNEAKKYIDIVQLRTSEVDTAHPTSFTLEETPFLWYGEYMKKHVPGLVIGVIGGFHYADTCEKALAEGKADLICAGRAYVSNPNYGDLILAGRGDDIVPCLRCNKCHGRGEHDPFVSVCSVNPMLGLEHRVHQLIQPTVRSKRVAVIGGGPAGMRCALFLKDRGHTPVVYEAEPVLGGQIVHADYADFKWTLRDYKNWLIYQLDKQGIEVRLNTKATPEMIKAENYDAVVVANGADMLTLPIPGADKDKLVYALEAFAHPEKLGKRVVVIGGGEVGVETALYIAKQGHDTTVVEMRDRLSADSTAIHYYSMFKEAWEAEPNFHGITGVKVARIGDGFVAYTDKDGVEHSIEADSVVMCAGRVPREQEALSFYGCAPEYYTIGDCKKPASVQQGNRHAWSVANRI